MNDLRRTEWRGGLIRFTPMPSGLVFGTGPRRAWRFGSRVGRFRGRAHHLSMIPGHYRTDESAGKKPSRHEKSTVALRASVGSTEARNGRLARVGRIDRRVERSPCARRSDRPCASGAAQDSGRPERASKPGVLWPPSRASSGHIGLFSRRRRKVICGPRASPLTGGNGPFAVPSRPPRPSSTCGDPAAFGPGSPGGMRTRSVR
jgi:hypothetical protein